ncbi:M20 family metallopeptidase [Tindallia californiensis]|uniref:Glutamate carboxypeptidase n=1 Tax=Tindallia californiensis TaxID=159292 RepID=A0A1H3MFV9_9FIRM|nr:M20 family metallopeptidase [Tindallia californiensis]SDY75526.1 glutamate carboxypeptidase [Tindallia californiensis]
MQLNIEKYLEELEYLVNIDSGSKYPKGTGKVADFFVKKYKEIGWEVEEIKLSDEAGPILKINNKKNSDQYDVLLLGHMDTVFPVGEAKKRPFMIEGNKAFGPGVNDMKNGLLAMYYSIEHLQESEKLRNTSVCVLLNSDEEISSRYSNTMIREEAKKSACVFVLEPARADGSMVNERKGVGRYFIEFKGRAVHAGVEPEKGISAIEELGNWIIKLQQLTNFETGTTVNVGVISGGTVANVVAEKASAEVDLRFKNTEEAEKVDRTIRKMQQDPFVKGVEVEVRGGVTRPPMNPSRETLRLCEKISAIAEELKIETRWITTGGGSDGSLTADEGVVTIDAIGPVGGGSHGAGEYILLDSIEPRMQLLIKSLELVLKR